MKDRFNELSKKVNYCLKEGMYYIAWSCWDEMAGILHNEEKFKDELKLLILAFHSYLGNTGMIFLPMVKRIEISFLKSQIRIGELKEIYSEVVVENPNMKFVFAREIGFLVLECCINGKWEEGLDMIDSALLKMIRG